MTFMLKSPSDVALDIATAFRIRRLNLNWSQKTLAARSGVGYSTLKKFERTGKIALVSLLQLALVLGMLDVFENLLTDRIKSIPKTMKELQAYNTRKRGRE